MSISRSRTPKPSTMTAIGVRSPRYSKRYHIFERRTITWSASFGNNALFGSRPGGVGVGVGVSVGVGTSAGVFDDTSSGVAEEPALSVAEGLVGVLGAPLAMGSTSVESAGLA